MSPQTNPWLNKLWKLIGVLVLLMVALMALLSLTITSRAATVDVAAGNSIQAAIHSATPGDTIRVQAGTFSESLVITKSVMLLGGYDASFATRIPRATLISPTQRAISITGVALDVVIDGFEIANASANGEEGAGIYLVAQDETRVVINDNHIHHNSATYGGGMYITLDNRTHLEITNNEIAYNTAANDYGGFYAFNTLSNTVILRNNVIVSNTANYIAGFSLSLEDFGQFYVEDNQILYNTAIDEDYGGFDFRAAKNIIGQFNRNQVQYNEAAENTGGGHIWLEKTVTSTFNDNTFHGNTADESNGGLYLRLIENVQVTGNRLMITDNTAEDDHGGMQVKLERGSSLTMTHGITIANNKTVNGNYGGAKFVFDSVNRLYAPNMVVYNNQAENGEHGGISWYASAQGLETIIVPNAHVISNTAAGAPGGAYLDLEHGSFADLTHSRFERNQAKSGSAGGLKIDDIEEGATLILNYSQFLTNTASGSGGGAYINTPEDGGFLRLIGVSFISNTSASQGGGLYMSGTSHGGLPDQEAFVISNTLFERNVSEGHGGGYYLSRCQYGCRYRIDHNHFIDNQAGNKGGAFYIGDSLADEGSWASFSYNKVLSNTASSSGGGIYLQQGLAYEGGYAVFNANLIAHNQANGSGGGGIYIMFKMARMPRL